MMNKLLIILLLFPGISFCQYEKPEIDSLAYYTRQLSEMRKQHQQILYNDSNYHHLNNNIKRLRSQSDSYRGYALYTIASTMDYDKLNEDLSNEGFEKFSGLIWSVGYGFSFKINHSLIDFNIGSLPIKKEVKNTNGDKVRLKNSYFLQLSYGYDFIKSKILNIYPYAGINVRSLELEYIMKPVLNPSPTNITDVILNDQSIESGSNEFGYMAGLGIELVLTNSSRPGGTLIYIKTGTNRAFNEKSLKLEDYKYKGEFKHGALQFEAGFKFFFR